ncbi:YdcF family protein [Chthonobacter rhizosphaerae]|uniref:YdcF family protein n=1 Tax=Chthonobacter rhizosphaerae TaxID=2735553 RepID=UPI0015EF5F6C|nr:YdcF family protein [Chthonobacter rhizosphaerae]
MFFIASKLIFLVLRPSNAVLLAMLVGLLLRRLGRRRTGAIVFSLGLGAAVVAAWTPLGNALILPLEQRFPQIAPPADEPTGVIILGGSIDPIATAQRGDYPQLLDGAERLIVGAEMARRYPNARIVFTGGSGDIISTERQESDVALTQLTGLGVPRERLVLETRSRNTRENAVFTYDILKPQPGDRWLLVTSAWHMPRSVGVFRAAGWTGLIPYPVDYRSVLDPPWFGRNFASEGLFLTDIAVKEYIGLVAYRFAGFTDALFPAP